MIVSHKYKFIFLKTNKTAGTSIEIALSKFCGPDDIITPIAEEDEEMRAELGYRGPQNYEKKGFLSKFLKKKKRAFYNHMPASEVKSRIPQDVWNSYYKFCIERNPWDRLLSLYYWRNKTEPRPSISEFIKSKAPLALKRKGFGVYSINGEVIVDKVCKFEKLAEELEEVRLKLGIPEPLELPRAKSKFRVEKKHYREMLSEADREVIDEMFREEIELMGYEW